MVDSFLNGRQSGQCSALKVQAESAADKFLRCMACSTAADCQKHANFLLEALRSLTQLQMALNSLILAGCCSTGQTPA
jgi:hypothetical protein